MPLRRKLLFSMLIPAFLIAVVGVVGVYSLQHLEQAAERILSDNYQSIQNTRRMERSLWRLETAVTGAVSSAPDITRREKLVETFEEALGGCESNITEPGENAVLSRIRESWNTLRPRLLRPDQPTADMLAENRETADSLHDDIAELVSLNERAMVAYERETGRVARVMVGGVAISALAAVLALAVFALVSAHRISRPVTQVADRLHDALNPIHEAGDYPSGGGDEIARLRGELDALLERLAHYEDEQNRKLAHMQGRLAFVINEVLEGLVLVDDERRILAVNRVARRILGLGNGEGLRLDDLQPSDQVKRMLAPIIAGTFQPERDLGELRYDIDGDERVYRPRVLTVSAGEGAVEGYLILFWDVTEQRRFEESRRRFISMLSHQLKTPMTSLSMSVNLLREKLREAAPSQAELLSIASEDCNNLSSLVSELIEAAREVTPDLVLKPRRLDILRLLRAALRPLVSQAEEQGVELVVPSEDRPVIANVDPVKFPWVVTNIAGNALRYTNSGGQIKISIQHTEGHVEVAVADTGRGIAPDDLKNIFDAYFTPDSKPEPGTHGLGLAIAKEIVEAHQGRIEAESEPGKGTTFRILLPANQGE